MSIGTLRRAVDELVHEHALVRRQGKGTFVAQHGNDRFLFQFFHIEPRPDARFGDLRKAAEYPHVESVGLSSATVRRNPTPGHCASSQVIR
ncbi:MAG: hypothetical protein V9G09_09940 [Candidatus Nanopelagicales bacterium]